ncbi:uncharacterized protein LOC135847863 [Planococcus citri]|uniref:uncharacterized protein LOC135847863 n=1 Tax=Planococcus citri TaxID=170843 RepID=UPI0031F77F2A
MEEIFQFLRLLAVYSLISSVRSDPTEKPLIFQTKTLEIYPDWESLSIQVNSGPYAFACPAKGGDEELFNQRRSLDNKSVFVRYYSALKENHMGDILCKKYLKLAVVVRTTEADKKEKLVEFGYEVYIDTSQFKQEFNTSDFNQFGRLLPPTSPFNRALSFMANSNNAPTMDKKEQTNIGSKTVSQTLDFIWFSRAVLKYNFDTWNVEKLTYFITPDVDQLDAMCTDNELGANFFDKNEPNRFYWLSAQERIFKEVILPKDLLKDGGECKIAQNCVKQYNLLWSYQYRSALTRSFSCSELTTIPVWYETAKEPLNYSEKFLIAGAKVTKRELKIIAGTHEILKFPSKKYDNDQEMYLQISKTTNKIPIPKLIYKIVRYNSHECIGEDEENICWFDMVIVIHNQPEVLPTDIICEDKSEEWGWESIRFMSTTNKNVDEKSKFIYVCELNETLGKKLGYVSDTRKGDLKLNYFPYYNEGEKKLEFVDGMKKDFEEKMRDLFEQSS